MTIDTPSVAIVETSAPANAAPTSYVDWPAILAGIVLASAISLVLLTFGSAVGLGFTDFNARDGAAPIWIGIAAASWLLWVQISSFMAGGYLTGRMRRRAFDASEHESDIRDGSHGLLVWAGALVVGAIIAVSGIGAAANAVGSVVSTAATATANVAGEALAEADPTDYFVDTLFRPVAGPTTGPGEDTPEATRGEVGRILIRSATTGAVSDADRTYLAQLVSTSTGLDQAEAEARVDQVIADIEAARVEAVELAEQARVMTVIGAFLIAASLLVSGVGAYWAASMGGRHRDEGTVFAGVFRRF